jgi:hypothetical protein
MPKKIAADTDARIFEVIGRHADGIGMDALHARLEDAISRRSLQRWLARFVAEGRLVKEGKQRGLRYRLAPITAEGNIRFPALAVSGHAEAYVPLSPEGQEIKNHVRQPCQMRIPVGYNQGFLEAYYPNETTYLSDKLRDQLRMLGTPPDGDRTAGTFARDIMNRLLIDLSWASSRLEGNTYSRLDTERLIEFGQAAEGKDALETQMILNHKAAIELLVNEADLVDFTPFTVFSLHALLSDGLLVDRSACGRIRNRPVDISGSVYRPIAMPQRIDELFRIVLSMAKEIRDPFEQSFFAMVHLPYLQPFEDVNKRVTRLAANIPLIRHNLCPLSFIDVPERAYIDAMLGVYELNRIELLRDVFVWAYERSCQQYLAVRRELVPPDTFRLRYRTALSEAVRSIILGLQPPTEETVIAAIPSSVANEDHGKFVALVLEEFESLHEGNAIRFGIRPSEFAVWLEKRKPAA